MPKRAFLIGGAVAASAALLLLTLLAGPDTATAPGERPSDPGLADLPTNDATTAPEPAPDPARPIQVGRGDVGKWVFGNDTPTPTILQWASIMPKPEGVSDVVGPEARTFFSSSRVLQMTAREGTIVAPDNEPRKGNLRGDVVLTLYENPDGQPLNFDDPAGLADAVTMKVYLDDAAFDLELGQVDSPGPVHLTGPQVDFRGTGLSLNFNQLRQRLERLEITHGERLRFRPTSKPEAAEPVAGEPAAAPPAPATAPTIATVDATPPTAEPAPAQSSDTTPATLASADTQPTDAAPAAEPTAPAPAEAMAAIDTETTQPSEAATPVDASPTTEMAAPSAEAPAASAPNAAPDEPPVAIAEAALAAPDAAPADASATQPATPAEPDADSQFYRARFQKDVRVVTAKGGDEGRVTMTGDELAVIFAMAPDDEDDAEPAPAAPAPPPAGAPAPADAVTSTTDPAAPPIIASAPSPTADRSLMPERDDDIVITWTGRLIVQPHAEGRETIAGPDDVLVAMTGSEAQPVVVETASGETITAAHAQYHAGATEVQASASEATPMRIASPELGVITGQAITLNQTAGTGSVKGPGWLRGNVRRPTPREDRADAAAALDAAAMPIAPDSPQSAGANADATTPAADAAPSEADAPTPAPDRARDAAAAASADPAATGITPVLPIAPQVPTDDAATPPAEPEALEVAWADRLDITFFKDTEPSLDPAPAAAADANAAPLDRLADTGELGGIHTATFFGDVTAEHPRFRMAGHELGITLTDPAGTGADSTIDAVRGRGNVQLFAQAEDPQDQLDLTAEELDIDFAVDPQGELYPAEVIAARNVVVKQPTLELRSERLELATVPRDPAAEQDAADADDDAEKPQHRLAVRRMVALGGVEVDITEPQLQLTGDRLSVDESGDRIELFGAAGVPAQVQQSDGTLYGDHVIVGQKSQTVAVVGPGHIDLETVPDQKDAKLRVDWQDSMEFDNAAGAAVFTGSVEAKTASPTDRTTLRADALELEFEPDTAAPASDAATPEAATADATIVSPSAPTDATPADDDTPETPESRNPRIRVATARGNAVFATESFDPTPPRATVTSVFQLRGPVIAFTNVPGREQVDVPGPGQMLISDTRPTQVRRPIADGRATEVTDVSGRGDTGFTWTDRLTMDGAANRMTMRGDVKVTHRPAKSATDANPQPIFFSAQRVVADLENTAGVSSWMESDGPKPQLTHIEAHDRVEIRDRGRGADIQADDLAYDEKTGDLTLTARAGGLVRVSDQRHPVPVTGRVIIYNPRTGKVDIREPGSATVPIERDRNRKRRP